MVWGLKMNNFIESIDNLIDKYYDKQLHIETCKVEDTNNGVLFYQYEPSHYRILAHIFKKYSFKEQDCFVDIGCGKGRTLIFAAEYGCRNIVGVEINKKIFEVLRDNTNSYKNKKKAAISIYNINALDMVIDRRMNVFFFFNPFHIKIFVYIIKSIIKSYRECPRKILLIFVYPVESTIKYIERTGEFRLIEKNIKSHYCIYQNI